MTGPVKADPFYKRPFDIEAYPIDFTKRLPAGVVVGSASGVAVDDTGAAAAIVAAWSIRAGSKIVDVVLTGGAKGKGYLVSLQAVGDGAATPTRWQQEVQIRVLVV